MKTDLITPESELVSLINKEQQYKFIGRLRKPTGQKLWACDMKTGTVSEVIAEVSPVQHTVGNDGTITKTAKSKVLGKHDTLYTFALNTQNAIKKFRKGNCFRIA